MIPSALDRFDEIIAAARGKWVAVLLDYDGTLTPIVSHPEKALLSDSIRQTLRALAARLPVAILSGRDLDDVRQRVNIDTIIYGGSHGFDLAGPHGLRKRVAADFLPALDAAENELRKMLTPIPGALVERKRFSVAAHYRNVDEHDVGKVERFVNEAASRHSELRRIENKNVFELQPNVDWDKGKGLSWIVDSLGRERQEIFPIYIGDDVTDEDAFRAIARRGAGILVSEHWRATAARYALKNPSEVERFLRELISSLT